MNNDEIRRKRLLALTKNLPSPTATQSNPPSQQTVSQQSPSRPKVPSTPTTPKHQEQPARLTPSPSRNSSQPVPVPPTVTVPSSPDHVFPYLFGESLEPTSLNVSSQVASLLSRVQSAADRFSIIQSISSKFSKLPNPLIASLPHLTSSLANSFSVLLYAPVHFSLRPLSPSQVVLELSSHSPEVVYVLLFSEHGYSACKACILELIQAIKSFTSYSFDTTLSQLSSLALLDNRLFELILPEISSENLVSKFGNIAPIAAVFTAFKISSAFFSNIGGNAHLAPMHFDGVKNTIKSANTFWFSLLSSQKTRSKTLDYLWSIVRLILPRQMINPTSELPSDLNLIAFYSSLSPFAIQLSSRDGDAISKVDPDFVNHDYRLPYSSDIRIKQTSTIIDERRIHSEKNTFIQAANQSIKTEKDLEFNLNTEIFFLLITTVACTIIPVQRDAMQRHQSLARARNEILGHPQGHPMRVRGEMVLKEEEGKIKSVMQAISSPIVVEMSILTGGLTAYFAKNLLSSRILHENFVPPDDHPYWNLPGAFFEDPFFLVFSVSRMLARPNYDRLLSHLDLIRSSFSAFLYISPLMGRSDLLPNPEIRGKLVQVVQSILIYEPLSGLKILSNNLISNAFIHSLVDVFVAFEATGSHTVFYSKFGIRESISKIVEVMDKVGSFGQSFANFSITASDSTIILLQQFVTLLLNDIQFLLDDGVSKLTESIDYQENQQSRDQSRDPEEAPRSVVEIRQHALTLIKWGASSLNLCSLVASYIPSYFSSSAVISRSSNTLASLIVAFTGHGTSKSALELLDSIGKTLEEDDSKIDSLSLAFKVGSVLAVLSDIPKFDEQLAQDLAALQCTTLSKFVNLVSPGLLESRQRKLYSLITRMNSLTSFVKHKELLAERAPMEYLDALMDTLMEDPVKLPGGQVMDKAVLYRMLLADPRDPFTRAPLSMDEVTELPELKREISEWAQRESQSL
ncbi:hypothetical protein RCL1_002184 [Eukaryota sp. TZLM3-RCL]